MTTKRGQWMVRRNLNHSRLISKYQGLIDQNQWQENYFTTKFYGDILKKAQEFKSIPAKK